MTRLILIAAALMLVGGKVWATSTTIICQIDYTFDTSPDGKQTGPTSGENTYSISDKGIQIHDERCDKASNIQFTDKLISIQCNYLLQAGMKESVVIHKINRYSGKYEQIRSSVGAEGALIHSGTCRRAQKKF